MFVPPAAEQALRRLIGWPTLYESQGAILGIRWPRGLLLRGPSGSGKSASVFAIAAEYGAQVHTITADRVIGAHLGESERLLREAFEAAETAAKEVKDSPPVVIFLDEVDTLCPRRAEQKQYQSRLAAQLLTLLDGVSGFANLVFVAATSRPNVLDPALLRPGRLDDEVVFLPPTLQERYAMLRLLSRLIPLHTDVDLEDIAARCSGYYGVDIAALCRHATLEALSSGAGRNLTKADFLDALGRTVPTLMRSSQAQPLQVEWVDICGLEDTKLRLRQAIEWPMFYATSFERLNIPLPRGILMHGPPGCCKTTLARAVSSSLHSNFITLLGTQLHSLYVGEGEAMLREAFEQARCVAPSILFIDEIDSIGAKRTNSARTNAAMSTRLLSALLVEMDGIEMSRGILVLAATNRLGAVDDALLRPGRFDVLLDVPLPTAEGRLHILERHSRSMPLAPDMNFPDIAARTLGYSGAALEAMCHDAALSALRDDLQGLQVGADHFAKALATSRP